MSASTASFSEATNQPRPRSIPLSHLSIEVGHLYMDDLAGGMQAVQRKLAVVAPWVRQATLSCSDSLDGRTARVSTCYLIDEYFTQTGSPAEVIPLVLAAAAAVGLTVDYLARESSCAFDGDVAIAELVAGMLVPEPHRDTNGSRPPPLESGWLSNGQRSPARPSAALKSPKGWQPPEESAANRHSIFVDVELWNDDGGRRLYSCPFLAAVWQLARLGLLRHEGRPLLQPQPVPEEWPETWSAVPAVVQLNPDAAPFSAYGTASIIAERFLPIEHAVRTVLSQVAVDAAAVGQITKQAKGEGLELSDGIVERIGYVFTPEPWISLRSPARSSRAPRSERSDRPPDPSAAPDGY